MKPTTHPFSDNEVEYFEANLSYSGTNNGNYIIRFPHFDQLYIEGIMPIVCINRTLQFNCTVTKNTATERMIICRYGIVNGISVRRENKHYKAIFCKTIIPN